MENGRAAGGIKEFFASQEAELNEQRKTEQRKQSVLLLREKIFELDPELADEVLDLRRAYAEIQDLKELDRLAAWTLAEEIAEEIVNSGLQLVRFEDLKTSNSGAYDTQTEGNGRAVSPAGESQRNPDDKYLYGDEPGTHKIEDLMQPTWLQEHPGGGSGTRSFLRKERIYKICPKCNGTGAVGGTECRRCGGVRSVGTRQFQVLQIESMGAKPLPSSRSGIRVGWKKSSRRRGAGLIGSEPRTGLVEEMVPIKIHAYWKASHSKSLGENKIGFEDIWRWFKAAYRPEFAGAVGRGDFTALEQQIWSVGHTMSSRKGPLAKAGQPPVFSGKQGRLRERVLPTIEDDIRQLKKLNPELHGGHIVTMAIMAYRQICMKLGSVSPVDPNAENPDLCGCPGVAMDAPPTSSSRAEWNRVVDWTMSGAPHIVSILRHRLTYLEDPANRKSHDLEIEYHELKARFRST